MFDRSTYKEIGLPKIGLLLGIGSLFFLLNIFSSCSFYDNVTGYFNTYYNAQKNFSDALSEIEKNPQKARDTNYFATYSIPRGAADKLDKVIEKCSKLIQLYPQSSWIDDAIMMIGEAYVYKGESESAIRKFEELLGNFPESDLCGEAKMLLAVSKYQALRDNEALLISGEVIKEAEQEGEDDRLLEASMLQGQIYIEREEYRSAVAVLDKAMAAKGKSSLLAEIAFQRGVCYGRLGERMKAAEAYGLVTSFGASFSKEFQARLRQGTMLAQERAFDEAFTVFSDLEGEALKPDERGLVELGIGNTHKMKGDTASAFEIYDRIDTLYKRTDASAKSYFERGLSFEYDYPDYKRAKEYYLRAKTEYPTSEITPIAVKRFEALSNYFKLTGNLIRYDSLIALKALQDSAESLSDSSALGDSTGGSPGALTPDLAEETTPLRADTLEVAEDIESYDNLETDLEPLPEEQSLQSALLSRRESGPMARERRMDGSPGGTLPGAGVDEGGRSESQAGLPKPAGPDPLLKVSVDSLYKLIGQAKFELGANYYLEMAQPDLALELYWEILSDYSESRFAPRACYAMAEIYRERADTLMYDSLTAVLKLRYKESEYAAALDDSSSLESRLKTDPVDSLYTTAYNLAMEGKSDTAMLMFDKISVENPGSPFAAKSLYVIGWLLERDAKNDSAAYWYKKLISEYPASTYAADAKPRVSIKDDPESAEKLIKVNEIPSLSKTAAPKKDKNKTEEQDKLKKSESPPPDELPDDEEPQDEDEEEEEPPPEDDEGGG